MAYIVLARKYRPQKFDDLTGQEHVAGLLKQSITAGRVGHGYLFCGPRGIGKTSCARILAKALNCQKGPAPDPCNTCPSCLEITKGNNFDVIEIDGASNRGIDEIRTLRENVKFAPNYGRYKIYIVDEVHMLTSEAFNALLKTLEEPPEHVKFIFATTAPNKLPSTIISRCQRFDFKRISIEKIMEILQNIAKSEKFKISEEARFAIAKAAQGSLRDALSILDQLSALTDNKVGASDVTTMLGLVETELLFALAGALAKKDCAEALTVLDQIINKGKDIRQLMKDLTEHFRHLMVIKIGGKNLGALIDYPENIKNLILKQTELLTVPEILASIDALIAAQETSRITESLRMPLEVAIAKIAYFRDPDSDENSKKKEKMTFEKSNPPADRVVLENPDKIALRNALELDDEAAAPEEIDLPEGEDFSDLIAADGDSDRNSEQLDLAQVRRAWNALTHSLSKKKMSVATYLQDGTPFRFSDGTLTIGFSTEAQFQMECLQPQDIRRLIEDNFSEKLKQEIRIQLQIVDNVTPRDEEPMVREALNTFNGKVINKWHSDAASDA